MKYFRPPSRRSFLETASALAVGLSAVLAAVSPAWIEFFGVDPDRGDGSIEWAIPIVLTVAAAFLGFAGRRHWRIDGAKAPSVPTSVHA